ncbi:alpha/beta hydrolase [Vagococcus xieshaowenii]|uniref:Alpha/beta hydrolase n=1 Tax=Vagococcus xieshaowenii TaxID=2562451 RepID=A0AAJ5EEZ1_9ENTE|nr:alpha/beta hydrolase [Vagococcus xieshaowenii]QCA28673.1 alpha/beta hydrolase [Vagococcus xieshaowenii]TFZ40519.1 alpha/beta hydrolase [Vagococcus xieshaowenii]
MEHRFIQGEEHQPVFVLLHGTGGSMEDLIPVAEHLNSDASILSLQGEVLENGMRRFFKRFPDASFDWCDLEKRGEQLLDFLKEAASMYQFKLSDVILVGYSNGANMAINLLLKEHGNRLNRAILFHPMYPTTETRTANLADVSIFASLGVKDPIVSVTQSEQVIALFADQGANVTQFWTTGHQLLQNEVEKARKWLKQQLENTD